MAYSAVIAGASGAVGGNALKGLLNSKRCTHVTIIGRKNLDLSKYTDDSQAIQKVTQLTNISFEEIEKIENENIIPLNTEVAICTLGVGQPSKHDMAYVRKVDHDYALSFARVCKKRGVKHFSLLTSAGSDATSWFEQLKMKGETENDVIALGFERVSFFRPAYIWTSENRFGPSDYFAKLISPITDYLLPSTFHSIKVEDLGRAFQKNAELPAKSPIEKLEYKDIVNVLKA